MRILLIYPYVPFPVNRGTYHRVFNLARELAARHEVDLFCLDEAGAATAAGYAAQFDFCARLKFHPFAHPRWPRLFPERLLEPLPTTVTHWRQPDVQPALNAFAAGQAYDLIHFCDLVLWPYAKAIPSPAPRVMDRSRVDLLFQQEELAHLQLSRRERLLRRENLWKLRRLERAAARDLHATVVCGPDDETFMRREIDAQARIFVLANGVDPAVFDRAAYPPMPDPEPTVLFCGAMDYTPNIDGLNWYFEQADDALRKAMPSRRVLIVGKNPVPAVQAYARRPGVTVTGEVPDVRPYYQRAWVQMVPLRIGGGTRLKIVESLSIGCPVVSTTIGAQGLDLQDGRHIRLADTPADFGGALADVLRDDGLRGRLAEDGRSQTLARYTWSSLGALLSDYYQSLLPARP
ncbi:MAG: glycosyltransferase family 4 protein [Opitutaceae bacterium]